jgi:hypothetical protein
VAWRAFQVEDQILEYHRAEVEVLVLLPFREEEGVVEAHPCWAMGVVEAHPCWALGEEADSRALGVDVVLQALGEEAGHRVLEEVVVQHRRTWRAEVERV